MLKYKGYTGRVEFDDEAGIFHGEVLDLRDVVTFQGKTVEELEHAFRDSIDDYLDFCAQRGEAPDRPFTGRLMLCLPPALHRRAYIRAQHEGKSLNQWTTNWPRLAEKPALPVPPRTVIRHGISGFPDTRYPASRNSWNPTDLSPY